MTKIKNLIYVAAGLAILVILWEAVVLTGRYEASLLPSPLDVLKAAVQLIKNGTLFSDIKVSLYRFIIGYSSAVTLAVILGLVLGRLTRTWKIIDPIVQVLRPVSPIAWFPFIVLWFGIGDMPAIVIIFIAAFYPVLLSTISAVKKVDEIYLKVARDFGIRKTNLLTRIIFPASFPYIANGLHIALGSAWVFLVAGEMVGAQSGLGYLIIDARNSLRSDMVLAGIIFIGISGLLLDRAIRFFEKRVEKRWGIVSREGI
ncbi:MAG: ABC transporter permease [Bacillota bacterium]|nr:ABC transporter permease [Bacillota bacterium]